jgi:hypothetical protein
VRDAEQPRAHRHVAAAAAQGLEGTRHRRLQRIAGILVVAQDRAAVAIQRLVMALEEHRERPRIARRGQRRQPFVAQQAQRPADHRGASDGDRMRAHG